MKDIFGNELVNTLSCQVIFGFAQFCVESEGYTLLLVQKISSEKQFVGQYNLIHGFCYERSVKIDIPINEHLYCVLARTQDLDFIEDFRTFWIEKTTKKALKTLPKNAQAMAKKVRKSLENYAFGNNLLKP